MSEEQKKNNQFCYNNTKYTKIFVGGLAWRTTTDGLRNFFQQFGEILDANVVCETYPGRSKGYGFVIFKDVESATRALQNPYPIIDGRRTNINLAFYGAKNNNNYSNQKGSPLYLAGSSHQYGNGSLNQPLPSHQYQPNMQYMNPHFPRFYRPMYYGQYPHAYNYPFYAQINNPMTTCSVRPRPMQLNLHQTNRVPVRISKPPVQNQEIILNVVHQHNNEEGVIEPENDDEQQEDRETVNQSGQEDELNAEDGIRVTTHQDQRVFEEESEEDTSQEKETSVMEKTHKKK